MTIKENVAAYEAAAHAMQTGVAFLMERGDKATEPKHLRVGINSAMVEHAALVRLLISKGVITDEDDLDLIPVPQYHTLDGWVNLYPDSYRGMKLCYWNSEEQANRHRTEECIACIRITQKFQEGEGL